MRRINTPDKKFRNKNSSQEGTPIIAEWLNDIQEEIANAIEGFGQEIDESIQNQLFTAISQILDNKAPLQHKHYNDDIEFIDSITGKKYKIIVENGALYLLEV